MPVNKKPLYQPWNEEEFQSDVFVRGMTPIQRWMYRTLLQASFFHTTRPYLPVDDEVLWVLAGCESQEQWDTHKARILKYCFVEIEIEGERLLENKRVTSDWAKLLEFRDEQSEKGQRRAAAAGRLPGGQFKSGKPGFINANHQPATAGEGLVENEESASRVPASEVKVSEDKISEVKITEPVTPQGSFNQAKPNLGCEWGNIRRAHSRAFGKKPDKGYFSRKYDDACKTYGEELVLYVFDEWAGSAREWVKGNGIEQPLHAFFKKLAELADEELANRADVAQDSKVREAEQTQQAAQQKIVDDNVEQQRKKDVEFFTSEPPPENGGSVLDYLAELES